MSIAVLLYAAVVSNQIILPKRVAEIWYIIWWRRWWCSALLQLQFKLCDTFFLSLIFGWLYRGRTKYAVRGKYYFFRSCNDELMRWLQNRLINYDRTRFWFEYLSWRQKSWIIIDHRLSKVMFKEGALMTRVNDGFSTIAHRTTQVQTEG